MSDNTPSDDSSSDESTLKRLYNRATEGRYGDESAAMRDDDIELLLDAAVEIEDLTYRVEQLERKLHLSEGIEHG